MDRVIEMQVSGYQIRRGGEVLGAMGTGNAVLLRLSFDAAWEGLSKCAKFTDARGEGGITTEVELLTKGPDGSYTVAVPREAMAYEGMAELSLVGELTENGIVTKRLTTKPLPLRICASGADRKAQNTEPITATDKQQILAKVDVAESYAKGTANGEPVPERAEDNAKYYKEQAQRLAGEASGSADKACGYADDARIYAEESTGQAGAAAASAKEADEHRLNAKGYAIQANTDATKAAEDATKAAASATKAAASVSQASASAEAAAASAEDVFSSLGYIVAAEYDPDKNYSAGDLVIYDNRLLRFETDHIGKGEDLDMGEVVAVTVGGELSRRYIMPPDGIHGSDIKPGTIDETKLARRLLDAVYDSYPNEEQSGGIISTKLGANGVPVKDMAVGLKTTGTGIGTLTIRNYGLNLLDYANGLTTLSVKKPNGEKVSRAGYALYLPEGYYFLSASLKQEGETFNIAVFDGETDKTLENVWVRSGKHPTVINEAGGTIWITSTTEISDNCARKIRIDQGDVLYIFSPFVGYPSGKPHFDIAFNNIQVERGSDIAYDASNPLPATTPLWSYGTPDEVTSEYERGEEFTMHFEMKTRLGVNNIFPVLPLPEDVTEATLYGKIRLDPTLVYEELKSAVVAAGSI